MLTSARSSLRAHWRPLMGQGNNKRWPESSANLNYWWKRCLWFRKNPSLNRKKSCRTDKRVAFLEHGCGWYQQGPADLRGFLTLEKIGLFLNRKSNRKPLPAAEYASSREGPSASIASLRKNRSAKSLQSKELRFSKLIVGACRLWRYRTVLLICLAAENCYIIYL